MSARFFSRIKPIPAAKKTLLRIPKTLLLATILLVTLASNVAPAFADDTYKDYKTLFGDNTNTSTEDGWVINDPGYYNNISRFKYVAPVLNPEPDKGSTTCTAAGTCVDGLWFKFKMLFNIQSDVHVKSWQHLAPDGTERKDAFVIRNCDATKTNQDGSLNEQYCMYSRAVYVYSPDENISWWDHVKRNFGRVTSIAAGAATANPYISIKTLLLTEVPYQSKLETEDLKTFIIYRKSKDFDFVYTQSVDLIQGMGDGDVGSWMAIQQNGDPKIFTNYHFTLGDKRSASMWYCGVPFDTITADALKKAPQDPADSDAIKHFGNLCGGSAYFRITPEVPITIPATIQEVKDQQATGTLEQPNKQSAAEKSFLPECSLLFSSGSFLGCIARVVYYVIYSPIAWFARIMGSMFDFFFGYSLDDQSYRADFVTTAWKVIRDISNIFFIIIPIWTGLAAVFDIGSTSMKKVVPHLIINALIINFSLFATRIVIDISNVVARVFYNQIIVCKGECEKDKVTGAITNTVTGIGGYKQVSTQLLSGFDPQTIFSAETLDYAKAYQTFSDVKNDAANTDKINDSKQAPTDYNKDRSTSDYAGYFILVSLVAAAIMVSVAVMFWKSAFFFLGRVIGLYIVMIFSPFAFLTRENMPLVGSLSQLRWDDWKKDLTNYALLAPIFSFFLLIIYILTKSPFLRSGVQSISSDAGFLNKVLYITIPMLIIFFMIKYGVDIAKKYSGIVGTMVQNYANKTAGIAAGAAMGVAGLAGARVIGGAAKSLDTSRVGAGIRDMAAKGGFQGWLGKNLQRGLNKTQTASFDVRQSAVGRGLFKQMGVETDHKALGALSSIGLGLDVANRKGGLDADIKRRQESQEKDAKLLEEKMSDDQLKAYHERKKKHYEKKKKAYEEHVDDIVEGAMERTHGRAAVAAMKLSADQTQYNQARAIAMQNQNVINAINAIQKPEEPKPLRTKDEMTRDRRKEYTDNLKKGGILTQMLESLASTGALGRVASGVLGGTIGAAVGEQVRTIGDRLAAKKIGETTKIEKELKDIQETLDKGFKDLIALENFQNSQGYVNLTDTEKAEVIRGERSMFDLLSPQEKQQVEERMKSFSDDERKEHYSRVKAREENRYDMKDLQREYKQKREAYANSPMDPQMQQEFMSALKELEKAREHKRMWTNIDRYQEEQKKKLKGEDKKPTP